MSSSFHCFTLAALCRHPCDISFICCDCGARDVQSGQSLSERFGLESSIGDVVRRVTCRRCGGTFIVAAPLWGED